MSNPPEWAPRIWIDNYRIYLRYPSCHGAGEHTVDIPLNYTAMDVLRQVLNHQPSTPPKIGEPAMPTQEQMTAIYRHLARAPEPVTKVAPKPQERVGAPLNYIDLSSLFGGDK